MKHEFTINLEDDPVPIVLIFARTLRTQLALPGPANAVRSMSGSFAIKSTNDPQALTITVKDKTIALRHGVSADARIIIHADLNRFSDPRYQPVIAGQYRHPWFALQVGRLFKAGPAQEWASLAKHFWQVAKATKGMPSAISFVCTDQNKQIIVGEGQPTVEIHGTARHLATLLSGNSVLLEDVFRKKLQIKGSLHDMAVLSGVTIQMMLGELNDE